MALFRKLETSFWRDTVEDGLTKDEQHLYAYLLTNQSTQLCGIYKLGKIVACFESCLKQPEYEKAMIGLERKGKVKYCPETQEVFILRWHTKYPNKSETCKVRVANELNDVKCKDLVELREKVVDGYVYLPDEIEPDADEDVNPEPPAEYVKILGHLSDVTGREYGSKTKSYQGLIRAVRKANPGVTIQDFIDVIDVKARQWIPDPEHNGHVRPETLFSKKFPTYLAEAHQKKPATTQTKFDTRLCPVCGMSNINTNTANCLKCSFDLRKTGDQPAVDAYKEELINSGLAERMGL